MLGMTETLVVENARGLHWNKNPHKGLLMAQLWLQIHKFPLQTLLLLLLLLGTKHARTCAR